MSFLPLLFYYRLGACLDFFQRGFTIFFALNLPLKCAFLRNALSVKYAIFSRKTLCLKYFFLLRKKKDISSNRKVLLFKNYYTALNLKTLKLKEQEKSYELTNFDLNVS